MATGQVSARRAVNEYLDWDPLVREALEKGAAVVALESTVVAHGLPYPDNLETAREMREAVRSGGATPAIVGIVEGRIRIGLDDLQLERFATDPEVAKASSRDLPVLLSQAAWGATTVAGTVACAAIAGISVFATGGLRRRASGGRAHFRHLGGPARAGPFASGGGVQRRQVDSRSAQDHRGAGDRRGAGNRLSHRPAARVLLAR